MRRVAEVIDAWFDSGIDVVRAVALSLRESGARRSAVPGGFHLRRRRPDAGWFYSLLAIATGLGNALPHNEDGARRRIRNVIVNDLVLDAQGQKMSKSRGNAVDPWSVIGEHGADAIRFFLIEASQVWVPRRFDEQGIRDSAGRLLITLKNTYDGIFAQYANFGWAPSALDPALADRPRWTAGSCLGSPHVEHEADDYLQQLRADARGARRSGNSSTTTSRSGTCACRESSFYDVDSADSAARHLRRSTRF